MLACILNNEKAIQANILIVRVFISMREMILRNKDMLLKIEKLEQKTGVHDKEIQMIIETLRKMIISPPPKRNKIGFIQ